MSQSKCLAFSKAGEIRRAFTVLVVSFPCREVRRLSMVRVIRFELGKTLIPSHDAVTIVPSVDAGIPHPPLVIELAVLPSRPDLAAVVLTSLAGFKKATAMVSEAMEMQKIACPEQFDGVYLFNASVHGHRTQIEIAFSESQLRLRCSLAHHRSPFTIGSRWMEERHAVKLFADAVELVWTENKLPVPIETIFGPQHPEHTKGCAIIIDRAVRRVRWRPGTKVVKQALAVAVVFHVTAKSLRGVVEVKAKPKEQQRFTRQHQVQITASFEWPVLSGPQTKLTVF